MNDVTAIETRYQGYRFRSRLEARWAVFFDAIGEPWEYEREGYRLPSGPYLPDFWLPGLNCWIEIKGVMPNSGGVELRKCDELSELTDCRVILAVGLPGDEVMLENGVVHMGKQLIMQVYMRLYKGKVVMIAEDMDWPRDWSAVFSGETKPIPRSAFDSAKAARFEHGEHGGVNDAAKEFVEAVESYNRIGEEIDEVSTPNPSPPTTVLERIRSLKGIRKN